MVPKLVLGLLNVSKPQPAGHVKKHCGLFQPEKRMWSKPLPGCRKQEGSTFVEPPLFIWCPGLDSNQHSLSATTPSK